MIKKLILTIATFISIYYCLRFGYIWTAYGHGGQILGIPFAALMLIMTIKYFSNKSAYHKKKAFLFGITYFLTLAAFSVTVETIRATKEDYFGFLYYEPGGYVNKIFFGWLITGILIYLVLLKRLKSHHHNNNDNKLQVDNPL